MMEGRPELDAKGNDFAESEQLSQSRETDNVPAHSPTVSADDAQLNTSSKRESQDGQLEKVASTFEEQEARITPVESNGPPFSVFSRQQKRFIVVMASWAGFFSPVSGNIYFPALNSLSRDLNVSISLINLTLTSYMIFQGLAPAFIGDLADKAGNPLSVELSILSN